MPIPQQKVYTMIQRRAAGAGIATRMSCHSFRATGVTTDLQNGGKLEGRWPLASPPAPSVSTTAETIACRSTNRGAWFY
jgi:hypothetical protein